MRPSACLTALASMFLLFQVSAASAQTTVTSLKEPACKGEPGNAAALRSEHADVIYNCNGPARWRIRLVYAGAHVLAAFTPDKASKPVFVLRAPYDIGPRIEWVAAAKGAAPAAAIVRLHVRTGSKSTASALAVLGVTPGSMCIAGFVDGELADANVQARKLSDAVTAANGACPADSPQIIGTQSEALTEIVQSNRP